MASSRPARAASSCSPKACATATGTLATWPPSISPSTYPRRHSRRHPDYPIWTVVTTGGPMAHPDAVTTLYELARGGPYLESLPEGLVAYTDASVEDGLALQTRVLDRWRGAGETVGGWKVGWTSGKQRDSGGKDFRPF